jgi:hypothetical protein
MILSSDVLGSTTSTISDGAELPAAITDAFDPTEMAGLSALLRHHDIVLLSNSIVAIVSEQSEIGDIVVVLDGLGIPLVLRPQGEHFAIVGKAYFKIAGRDPVFSMGGAEFLTLV